MSGPAREPGTGRRAEARSLPGRRPRHHDLPVDPAVIPGAGPAPRFNGEGDRDGEQGGPDTGAAEPRPRRRVRRTVLEWVAVIGGGVIIALVVEAFFVQAFWIPSPSMTPTLQVGDRVLVNKLSYRFSDVDRGDLVVFERPAQASTGASDEINDLIKRVVATEGDTIEARDGRVLVNGDVIDEPYLDDGTATDNLSLQTIPDDHVFVMGDNRLNSEDSRVFGPVAEDRIVGRAFVRVLPLSDIGRL